MWRNNSIRLCLTHIIHWFHSSVLNLNFPHLIRSSFRVSTMPTTVSHVSSSPKLSPRPPSLHDYTPPSSCGSFCVSGVSSSTTGVCKLHPINILTLIRGRIIVRMFWYSALIELHDVYVTVRDHSKNDKPKIIITYLNNLVSRPLGFACIFVPSIILPCSSPHRYWVSDAPTVRLWRRCCWGCHKYSRRGLWSGSKPAQFNWSETKSAALRWVEWVDLCSETKRRSSYFYFLSRGKLVLVWWFN